MYKINPLYSQKSKPTKLSYSESQLQHAILEWLPYYGVRAWRMNSGMLPIAGKFGRVRLIRMGVAGTPDIIGYTTKQFLNGRHPGHMVAVEVKVGKNKPTDIQQRTLDEMTENGVYAFVAYSIEDVKQFFESLKNTH